MRSSNINIHNSLANTVRLSDDGSHTVMSEKFGTSYHSTFGAITESKTVFIAAGLEYLADVNAQSPLRIFEMGYGTGLNALLTAIWAKENKRAVVYHSIEAYPISNEVFSSLNYGNLLGDEELYLQIHESDWDQELKLNPYFSLKKINAEIESYPLASGYHLIYYDAFGPGTQEHLWEQEITDKLYTCLYKSGILTTYCAKGSFKRNLKASGFTVEGLPGPPGKREITRATKA